MLFFKKLTTEGKSMKRFILLLVLCLFTFNVVIFSQPLPTAKPEAVGMSSKRLSLIDDAVKKTLEAKKTPGVAVLVARHGKVVYKKAFGMSSLEPEKKELTTDMVFDMASVSKPVGTATSVMMLVEQGKLRLTDEVRRYVPEFVPFIDENGHAEHARIYHLLTHTSGLPDYTKADTVKLLYGNYCPDSIITYIARLKKHNPPGKEFEYSCLGFITLANIVKKVSGKSFDEFAKENIFEPLKMKHTTYAPKGDILKLCVPTERYDGKVLCGVVHDPLARLQGGVSGNAGLFSCLDDLGIFMQMMLNGGEYNGVRILSPVTVKLMTNIYPKTEASGRGLGWDVNSDYMGQRGDLFYWGCFGHTGFTGTSVNVDVPTGTIVIILSNRVHPDGKGDVIGLRRDIANIVASAIEKL
jgi:serine-type D-Ala-D-Ala carboxypeptidase